MKEKTLLIVGTYHKTGTVWLINIFNAFARQTGRQLFKGKQEDLPDSADIFFQHHSHIDMKALAARFPGRLLRGVHIIRDPRDIVVSATYYHTKCDEPWVNVPQPKFDGMTYKEKINSLPDDSARFIFEMENAASWTIRAMQKWNYNDPRFFELRYEELIEDAQLAIFSRAFEHLGLTGKDLEVALEIAFEKSLFSGKKLNPTHVRSGKSNQWSSLFSQEVLDHFNACFPDVINILTPEPTKSEKEPDIDVLQGALITPIKKVGQAVADYPPTARFIGCIYDGQGQAHTGSLLKRSIGQIQFAENDGPPTINTAGVRVKKGVYGGILNNHYGHFLLETLARVWALKDYPDDDIYFHSIPLKGVVINSFDDLNAWQKELFSAAFINTQRLHFMTEATYFDELIVPEPGFVIRDYCSQKQAHALAEIGGRIKIKAELKPMAEKVWLSRSLMKQGAIAGEKDFEEALEKEGFAIIHPESLSVGEQILLFEQARVIAGMTGSAFHTLLLAENKGARLLHFWRTTVNQNYITCAKAKGFNAEYFRFCIKTGTLENNDNPNVLQDLGKVWQVLHTQGLVKTETYHDPDLELKLQKLDEDSQTAYPPLVRTAPLMPQEQSSRFYHSTTLDELGLKYDTDKSTKGHDYLRFYEFYLAKFKQEPFTLLELGVGPARNKGKSLLTWKEYFPNANIVGVDIRPDAKTVETERVTVEIGDLGSLGFLSKLAAKYPTNKIVIDDASHLCSHQMLAFEKLFSTVAAGGIFIMEDIHTSFAPLNEEGYADCYEDAYSYFSKLTYLVCGKGRKHPYFNTNPPSAMQMALAKEIESISFYKETILIIKK